MTIPLYHSFALITSPKSPKGFWSSKLDQTYGVGNLFCRRRPCGLLGHSPLGFPPFTHARQTARLLSKKIACLRLRSNNAFFYSSSVGRTAPDCLLNRKQKERAKTQKIALSSLPKMASFPFPNSRPYRVLNILFHLVFLPWYTFSFLLVQSYYFLMYSADKQPVLMLRPRPKM